MKNILETLINASEKAARIARSCANSDNQNILVAEKGLDSNPRFDKDYKTIADVLAQECAKTLTASHFPELEGHVRGEECSEINGVTITMKETEEETFDLLKSILPEDTAKRMAQAAHSCVEDICLDTLSDISNIDCSDLGIWIDPIDGTAEFISGVQGSAKPGRGLPCVTVLIGAYLRSTGEAVVGVINQPFYDNMLLDNKERFGVTSLYALTELKKMLKQWVSCRKSLKPVVAEKRVKLNIFHTLSSYPNQIFDQHPIHISDWQLLHHLVTERVDAIENKNTDTTSNLRKQQAWNSIVTNFNLMAKGAKRNCSQLRTQWSHMKMAAKKAFIARSREMSEADGESSPNIDNADDVRSWSLQDFAIENNETDSDTQQETTNGKKKKLNRTSLDMDTNSTFSNIIEVTNTETECLKELHKMQMINESIKKKNLELKHEILKEKLKYYKAKNSELK